MRRAFFVVAAPVQSGVIKAPAQRTDQDLYHNLQRWLCQSSHNIGALVARDPHS